MTGTAHVHPPVGRALLLLLLLLATVLALLPSEREETGRRGELLNNHVAVTKAHTRGARFAAADEPGCPDGSTPNPALGNVEHLGCYQDDEERDLPHPQGRPHTAETCSEACAVFPFFAIQDWDECWCGEVYATQPKYTRLADPTDCPGQMGGAYRNSVFTRNAVKCIKDTTSTVTTTPTIPTATSATKFNVECPKGFVPNPALSQSQKPHGGAAIDTVEHIGCYQDDAERDLPHFKDRPHSASSCSKACSLFPFFAIQYWDECWCGNDFATQPKYAHLADEDCPDQTGGAYAILKFWRSLASLHLFSKWLASKIWI